MTFFHELQSATDGERGYLLTTPQIVDSLRGQISLATYLSYLAEAYHHVRHTVPLMTLARSNLRGGQTWMAPAFDEYIEEESGHEEWILEDIAASGGDATAARLGKPRPATEFMISYAYDFINRINPVGLFGMVFVLEGTSTQIATSGAAAIQSALGLNDNCFHYLTSHGSLDLEHMRFFESLVNRVTDEGDKADIVHMARRMYILFANMFRGIPHDKGIARAA